MLLDQKRTKRLIKISAVLTSVAFAGIALVVIIAIIASGGGTDPTADRVRAAEDRVHQQPDNAAAWDQLATARYLNGEREPAIEASKRAIELAPRDFPRTQTLVQIYTDGGQNDEAIATIEGFIKENPRSAEAFLQLGGVAENAGRTELARLSYQQFLRLDPDSSNADDVRQRLKQLQGGVVTAPTG